METFSERFNNLIKLLKRNGNPIIPIVQIREIELNPIFNPPLYPDPSDFFKNSFEWYLAVPLIPGGDYGPFYRIDGDHFWPQDSDGKNPYSEKNYFFGLQEPSDQTEAMRMYNMRSTTPRGYVHKFTIDAKTIGYISNASIFLGPVKNGTGYQFNANTATANIIRSLIIRNKIVSKKLPEKSSK